MEAEVVGCDLSDQTTMKHNWRRNEPISVDMKIHSRITDKYNDGDKYSDNADYDEDDDDISTVAYRCGEGEGLWGSSHPLSPPLAGSMIDQL